MANIQRWPPQIKHHVAKANSSQKGHVQLPAHPREAGTVMAAAATTAEPFVLSPWPLLCFLIWVLGVWTAFRLGHAPVFLAQPPVTRRSKFFELPGSQRCADGIQAGSWTDWPLAHSCTRQGLATCGEVAARRWAFGAQAAECGVRRYSRAEIQRLLGGKWVVFAGDSISRLLYAALLRAAGSPGQEVRLRHQDFEHTLEGGIRVTFLWRAYPSNLTREFQQWAWQQQQSANRSAAPDLVVCTVSLWHLAYVTNAGAFLEEMALLWEAAQGYLAAARPHPPQLLLGSTTETHTNRQRTALKRRNMTPQNVDAYNLALVDLGLLSGKGPFSHLDLFRLTHRCGEECSVDGVHSVPAVYDTGLQLILNLYRQWAEG